MKFSGLACLDMKNICEKIHCKQTSTQKVIALDLYTSIRTRHIQLNDTYMRHSTPDPMHFNVDTYMHHSATKVLRFCSNKHVWNHLKKIGERPYTSHVVSQPCS